MFTDMHLRELEPASWREDVVGTGSYGVVYRARWRGQEVAVKELKLPLEPKSTVYDTAALPQGFAVLCRSPVQSFDGTTL